MCIYECIDGNGYFFLFVFVLMGGPAEIATAFNQAILLRYGIFLWTKRRLHGCFMIWLDGTTWDLIRVCGRTLVIIFFLINEIPYVHHHLTYKWKKKIIRNWFTIYYVLELTHEIKLHIVVKSSVYLQVLQSIASSDNITNISENWYVDAVHDCQLLW